VKPCTMYIVHTIQPLTKNTSEITGTNLSRKTLLFLLDSANLYSCEDT